MNTKTRRSTKWLIVAFLLLSTIALNLPASARADASDFCRDCATDCLNDAWWAMMQCYQNGGTDTACHRQYDQTLNNCNAVFCNYGGNCDLPTNYPLPKPKPSILP